MKKPYFRPGAGGIIYNQTGEIAVFERRDLPGVWQLPQGGMELGETPIENLWRELEEETGVSATAIDKVIEYPDWTLYTYQEEVRRKFDESCLGQVHRWFYLKLSPEKTINLDKAEEKEFTAWHWSTFPELLAGTSAMKLPIYTSLAEFFFKEVHPDSV